ncbi:phosphatidylglycerol lysyltransferase domain-containing protein [Dactylosporangium sp. NPDC051484]|uniref:phosphatidylglycerol lysyltransferase domain-containing protein n=1 Tax=Dactylosporangium sp. NPDC051484 TaxID=3154942 RepID=UPI00344C4BAD
MAALLMVAALALGHDGDAWIPGGALPAVDRIPLAAILLLLAHGLVGRRRLALRVTLALAAVAAVMPPVHWQRLVLPVAAAVILLSDRGNYVVRADSQRLRAACAIVAVALVVTLGDVLWVSARHGEPLWRTAYAGLPFSLDASDQSGHVLVLVVLAAAVAALAVSLAAAPAPPPSGESDRARVRDLVQDPSAGSLAPFVTRTDRTYVFSPGGEAAIGYRVRFGVALAGGDPVGSAPAEAIAAFVAVCARHGWRPAVLGADAAATGELWRRAGVRRAVEIGDEAVLDVATFSLATRRMRNVRQAARRADNAGVQVRVGALGADLVPPLREVLQDWLHGRRERGFAMNLDAILTPRTDAVYAVARDASGKPMAFARFLVAAGGRVLTLDVAPRRRDAVNGVVERMIVAVVEHARSVGATEVTLNFAGMRRVYSGEVRGARLVQLPLHALDRWIELRSLYLFTGKFHPRWRPRQLRLRSWWELIPVAVAALSAEFSAYSSSAAESPQEATDAPATS